MALHIQDDDADRLLRDFARRRRVDIATAIKIAVREADIHERQSFESFQARLKPILDEVASMPSLSDLDYKTLSDEM